MSETTETVMVSLCLALIAWQAIETWWLQRCVRKLEKPRPRGFITFWNENDARDIRDGMHIRLSETDGSESK